MRTGLLWALWSFAAVLAAAEPPAGEPQFVIGDTLGGDPVIREAVFRWSADHDGVFEIRSIAPEALGSPDNGCDAVLTDAGSEIRAGDGMTLLPYAVEAVVAAVAQNNPVSGVTAAELKRIYSGRIANWNALGGPDAAIVRAGVGKNAPGERAFQRCVMNRKAFDGGPVKPGDEVLPGMILYRKPAEAGVLAQGGSGVIVFGTPALGRVPGLKLLTVNGVAPTRENIRSGKYPLTLTRCVCFRERGALREFLRKLPEFAAARALTADDFLPVSGGGRTGQ